MAQFTLDELNRVVFISNKPDHMRPDPNTPFLVKKASYMKGEYPEQLKPYAGQIAECPVECEGRKGQEYRECLKACAAKVAKPEEEKRARRKAYSKTYRELIKKMYPRRFVRPRALMG